MISRDNHPPAMVPRKGRLRIGVSSCLLGNPVRYDGQDQGEPLISGIFGRFLELIPVCPEQECGMGVPREAMRLVGEAGEPSLMIISSGLDQTERMRGWCRQKIRELETDEIHGFIFKSHSPSCGPARVKVYPHHTGGHAERIGTGLFARAFAGHFPLLPVVDERTLQDLEERGNFIERIFCCQRWSATKKESLTAHGLVSFHSTNKLQVLAHSETHYRALGRVVAQTKAKPVAELFAAYEHLLMAALRLIPTPEKHTNVLQHILGYFKKMISTDEKQQLLSCLDQYRSGAIPLIIPITLLNHYARQYQQGYLTRQHYLDPHPDELMLRYHA